MPPTEIMLAVVVPLGIWAVVLAFVLAVLLAGNDGVGRLRRLHQVPCFRCRYYTGSAYLKCPVHPLMAASEAALHCRDYETRDFSALPPSPPQQGKPSPLPYPLRRPSPPPSPDI